MDYLRYRHKALLTMKWNLLFFEASATSESDVYVTTVALDGVPFICVIGSTTTIDSAVALIGYEYLEAEIGSTTSVSNTVNILESLGFLVTEIASLFEIQTNMVVGGAEKTSGLSDSVTDTECTIAAYLESDIVVSLVSSTTIALVTAIAEKNNFSASLQSTLTTLCSMNIRVPLYFEVDELGSVTAISSDATLSESITFDVSKCSTSDLSAGMTLLVTSILADYDNNTWVSIDNSILYLFDHIEK